MNDVGIDYALLIGQGRSGTNWLLHLLNQSARTHCRNEADQLEGSALRRLSPFRFFVDDEGALSELWNDVVYEAALSMGPRDHLVQHGKTWLFPGSRRLGFFWLRQRYLLLGKLGRPGLAMDAPEIRFPRWMTTPARLARAFHVFKLNAAVGIADWAVRRDVKVIHIVRHPGGFVKSWLSRWVRGEGHQQRAAADKDELRDAERLVALARRAPEWAERMGDLAAMSPLEGELWWWRYCNERLLGVGGGRPNYEVVVYEDLAERSAEVAEKVFRFCGLEWTPGIAERIAGASQASRGIAAAWKDEVDSGAVDAIERVLEGSQLGALWQRSGL